MTTPAHSPQLSPPSTCSTASIARRLFSFMVLSRSCSPSVGRLPEGRAAASARLFIVLTLPDTIPRAARAKSRDQPVPRPDLTVRIGPSFEVKKETRARIERKGEADFKWGGCSLRRLPPRFLRITVAEWRGHRERRGRQY